MVGDAAIRRALLAQFDMAFLNNIFAGPFWLVVMGVLFSGHLPLFGAADFSVHVSFGVLVLLSAGLGFALRRLSQTSLYSWPVARVRMAFACYFIYVGAACGAAIWLYWEPHLLANNVLLTLCMLIVAGAFLKLLTSDLMIFFCAYSVMTPIVFARLVTGDFEETRFIAFTYVMVIIWWALTAVFFYRSNLARAQDMAVMADLNDELQDVRAQLSDKVMDLQVADRAKNVFFASISHESQTPLNAIVGFSDMLLAGLAGPQTGRQKEYSENISRAAYHLKTIVRDILTLSALNSGKTTLSFETLDVRDPVRDAIALFCGARPDDMSRLDSALPDTPLLVRADRTRLAECCLNLITNAAKYAPSETPIRIEVVAAGNGAVDILVMDQGPGLPPEKVSGLLQPFQRDPSVSAGKIEGTGLGLPIVKKLVDAHGGQLDFRARDGGGLTVAMRFPLKDADAPAQKRQRTPALSKPQ